MKNWVGRRRVLVVFALLLLVPIIVLLVARLTETLDARISSPDGKYLATQTCFYSSLVGREGGERFGWSVTGVWVYDTHRIKNNSPTPSYERVYIWGIETCNGIAIQWQDNSTLVIRYLYRDADKVNYRETPPDDLHIIQRTSYDRN